MYESLHLHQSGKKKKKKAVTKREMQGFLFCKILFGLLREFNFKVYVFFFFLYDSTQKHIFGITQKHFCMHVHLLKYQVYLYFKIKSQS